MRIAFDLDDTLIPTTQDFSVGSRHCIFPMKLMFRERIRSDAPPLLCELSLEHELWIYTTSLRSERYVKCWFRLFGISISHVVNHDVHVRHVTNTSFSQYSKAPKLFGIDLMIDDQIGVEVECAQQNCRSVIITPSDNDWVIKVRSAVL